MFYTGLDSWIYILFGILWIAFAIYKGNNKAAKPGEAEKTKTTATNSSWLEDRVDAFSEKEDAVEGVFENGEAEEVEIPADVLAKQEEPADTIKEGVRTMSPMEEKTKVAPPVKSRRINLKKAVIYSEILHRPYE